MLPPDFLFRVLHDCDLTDRFCPACGRQGTYWTYPRVPYVYGYMGLWGYNGLLAVPGTAHTAVSPLFLAHEVNHNGGTLPQCALIIIDNNNNNCVSSMRPVPTG